MSKLAEDIVFDIIDELTDYSAFHECYLFTMNEDERKILNQSLVGIIDQNIERFEKVKTVR